MRHIICHSRLGVASLSRCITSSQLSTMRPKPTSRLTSPPTSTLLEAVLGDTTTYWIT